MEKSNILNWRKYRNRFSDRSLIYVTGSAQPAKQTMWIIIIIINNVCTQKFTLNFPIQRILNAHIKCNSTRAQMREGIFDVYASGRGEYSRKLMRENK